jgi:hypothetical protein
MRKHVVAVLHDTPLSVFDVPVLFGLDNSAFSPFALSLIAASREQRLGTLRPAVPRELYGFPCRRRRIVAVLKPEPGRKRSAGLEAEGRRTRNWEAKVTRRKDKESEISDRMGSRRVVREPDVGNRGIGDREN